MNAYRLLQLHAEREVRSNLRFTQESVFAISLFKCKHLRANISMIKLTPNSGISSRSPSAKRAVSNNVFWLSWVQLISEEINELTDQLNHARSRTLEVEKVSKRFEAERQELQTTLEEAESALEQEEAKAQRAQVEVNLVKEDLEKRLAEKDEEFDAIRWLNIKQVINSLQS